MSVFGFFMAPVRAVGAVASWTGGQLVAATQSVLSISSGTNRAQVELYSAKAAIGTQLLAQSAAKQPLMVDIEKVERVAEATSKMSDRLLRETIREMWDLYVHRAPGSKLEIQSDADITGSEWLFRWIAVVNHQPTAPGRTQAARIYKVMYEYLPGIAWWSDSNIMTDMAAGAFTHNPTVAASPVDVKKESVSAPSASETTLASGLIVP